jgi:serine/threonine protein kinase
VSLPVQMLTRVSCAATSLQEDSASQRSTTSRNQGMNWIDSILNVFTSNITEFKLGKYKRTGKILGKGSSGVVEEWIDTASSQRYAVKIIKRTLAMAEQLVRKEVNVLRGIKHPNIVKLLDLVETENAFFLVFPLCTGGELFEKISTSRQGFSEADVAVIVATVTNAVVFLHDMNIIHRDIKPENLMFVDANEQSSLVLVDFGIAQQLNGNLEKVVCGSPGYTAPEVLSGKGYGKPVDIWSIGVVCYTLLYGANPFDQARDLSDFYSRVKAGKIRLASPNVSLLAKNFVACLMQVDATIRPTALQVLKHPWITKWVPESYLTYLSNINVEARSKKPIPIPNSDTPHEQQSVISTSLTGIRQISTNQMTPPNQPNALPNLLDQDADAKSRYQLVSSKATSQETSWMSIGHQRIHSTDPSKYPDSPVAESFDGRESEASMNVSPTPSPRRMIKSESSMTVTSETDPVLEDLVRNMEV